mgnify:CR=1 FL=1
MRVLAVDIGNTKIKFAVVDGESLRHLEATETGSEVRSPKGVGAIDGIAVVSVVPSVTRKVVEVLQSATGADAHLIERGPPWLMPHAYATPQTLGMDRMLAAYEAFARCGAPCVIVDAGSALTVDWVDESGVYRGGAIAPGLRALQAGLKHVAPALDPPPLSIHVAYPGCSTTDALTVGLSGMAIGGAQWLLDRALGKAGPGAVLWICGGDAAFLMESLVRRGHALCHEPDLLLRGLYRWFLSRVGT